MGPTHQTNISFCKCVARPSHNYALLEDQRPRHRQQNPAQSRQQEACSLILVPRLHDRPLMFGVIGCTHARRRRRSVCVTERRYQGGVGCNLLYSFVGITKGLSAARPPLYLLFHNLMRKQFLVHFNPLFLSLVKINK